MKIRILFLMAISAMVIFIACKKDVVISKPSITFTDGVASGTANVNGEYVLTGHISSAVALSKLTITRQGETAAYLTDDTTIKNKNDYDYKYTITGIAQNTTCTINIYDENGGMTTTQFLIMKN